MEGKKVIVRVDYNVPIKNGRVEDDTRLKATMPTINFLLEKNCRIVLMSHLGRPKDLIEKGITMEDAKKMLTLNPVAKELSNILNKEVFFIDDCINIKIPQNKNIVLLENLRFHHEEEKNNEDFAEKLSKNGQIYVNDAFGASHRAHASVSAITKFLPSCAGFLVEKEVNELSKILNPEKPFVAIVAGAKADKIGPLKILAKKADYILIAGVLANTFLKAKGSDIGSSKFDEETFNVVQEIITIAGKKLILPSDFIAADKFDSNANIKTLKISQLEKGWMALDIGPETIQNYKNILKKAKTVLWTGPLGVFEMEKFSNGTRQIGDFIANLNANKIIGGGDSAAAVEKFNLANKMTHVSTGGGASLEFIEKEGKLPALVALEAYYNKSKQK